MSADRMRHQPHTCPSPRLRPQDFYGFSVPEEQPLLTTSFINRLTFTIIYINLACQSVISNDLPFKKGLARLIIVLSKPFYPIVSAEDIVCTKI